MTFAEDNINGIALLPFQYGDTPIVSYADIEKKLDEYAEGSRDEYCVISQRGGQTDMLSNDADIVIGGGSRGGPLIVDTRVVTPFGYRRIGDLKAGDIISGTDGGMQRVVYRKDHGLLPCYKLKFIDGSEVVASYDHLWNVANKGSEKYFVTTTESIIALIDAKTDPHVPICEPLVLTPTKGSIEERRDFIAGYFGEDYNYAFGTTDKDFAENLKHIAGSIGLLAEITLVEDTYNVRVLKDTERTIIGYEYVGERECCCIAVNNTNSLFMVEDFIVTHNSKSFSLLLYPLNYIDKPNFRGIIFRHAEDDLQDLKDTSKEVFDSFGTQKIDAGKWDFKSGGWLQFDYYGDDFGKFETRFRGRQFAYIGVDEVTQMSFDMFKFICTCSRNAYGYRNRFFGTCNPDPDSWVRPFINWWIANEETIWPDGQRHPERAGIPDPSRNGKIRYCFMDGDSVDQIYWGDTREEVFEQCKEKIMSRYDEKKFGRFGTPAQLFIKSVAFVEAKLGDNVALMASDPAYLANLLGQSESNRSRDLDGNWNFKALAKEVLTRKMMEGFYTNAYQYGDHQKWVSLDAALDGGDNLTMWLWEGYHIKDLFTCKLDSRRTVKAIKAKMQQWGVPEQHFTYDLNGVGQLLKGYFPNAVPFNNREAPPEEYKDIYANVKSMAADLFVQKIREREISIETNLLKTLQYGKGYSGMELKSVLDKERLAIAWDTAKGEYHGSTLIKKSDMIKLVGHSPDFIEGIFMRMIFDIKKPHKRPTGFYSQSRPRVLFSRKRRRAF